MTKAGWTRWEHGSFKLILTSGQHIYFEGAVRYQRVEDGYGAIEINSPQFSMSPSFNAIDCVVRVRP